MNAIRIVAGMLVVLSSCGGVCVRAQGVLDLCNAFDAGRPYTAPSCGGGHELKANHSSEGEYDGGSVWYHLCYTENCCSSQEITGEVKLACSTLTGSGHTTNASIGGTSSSGYTITVGGGPPGSVSCTDGSTHSVSGGWGVNRSDDSPQNYQCPNIPPGWKKGAHWRSIDCAVVEYFNFRHCDGLSVKDAGEMSSTYTIKRCYIENVAQQCTYGP